MSRRIKCSGFGVRKKRGATRAKVLAMVISVTMLVTMIPSMAFADEGGGSGNPTPTVVKDAAYYQGLYDDLLGKYNALPQEAKDGQTGGDIVTALGKLDTMITELRTAEGKVGSWDQDISDAEKELAKYAEGTITRQMGSVSTNIVTYSADYIFTISGGGESWRKAVGVPDGYGDADYTARKNVSWLRSGGNTSGTTELIIGGFFVTEKYWQYFVLKNGITGIQTLLNQIGFNSVDAFYGATYTNARKAANRELYGSTDPADPYDGLYKQKNDNDNIISNNPGKMETLIPAIKELIKKAEDEAYNIAITLTGDANDIWLQLGKSGEFNYSIVKNYPSAVTIAADWEIEGYGKSYSDAYIDAAITGDGKLSVTAKEKTPAKVNLVLVSNATCEPSPYNITNPTAEYPVSVSVAEIGLKFTEGPGVTDDNLPGMIEITKGSGHNDKIFKFVGYGGQGSYTYSFAGTVDSRISYNLTNRTITVGKDTNSGTYTYDVTITNTTSGLKATQTVTLNVRNQYDEEYKAQLAELQKIEDDIQLLIELAKLIPGGADNDYLKALSTFADVTAQYKAMWNNGKPEYTNLDGLKTMLNSIGAINSDIKFFTDIAITGLNALSDGLKTPIVSTILNSLIGGKDFFIDGYKLSILEVSPAKLYYEAVTGAYDTFQSQVSPVTNLIKAYQELQSYVTNADYKSLKSVGSINAYIQGLYDKYAAFDDALKAFNDAPNNIFAGIIDGLLKSANSLLDLGLGLVGSNVGGQAISGLLDSLLAQYITDATIRSTLTGLLGQGIDGLADLIDNVDLSGLTLDKLVGYSGQVREALLKIAKVSALIDATINYGKGFNLGEYDLSLLNMLKGLTDMYQAYLEAIDKSSASDVANALRKDIDDLIKKITDNKDVQTAVEVYQKIQDIYGKITGAINYFNSGQAKIDYEKAKQELITRLEALAQAALDQGKKELAAQIEILKQKIRDAAASAIADINSDINKAIKDLFAQIAPEIQKLKDLYNDAVAAYNKAKEIYDKALKAYQDAQRAYEAIKAFLSNAGANFEKAKAELITQLTELAEQANAELKIKISNLIEQVKAATAAELANINSAINQAINDLLKDIAGHIDAAKIAAFEKALEAYHKAIEALAKANSAFDALKDYINNAINDATAQAKALNAAIDAIIRAIPNPTITSDGNIFTKDDDSIQYTTSANWLFDVLEQSLGIKPPVYDLADNHDGLFVLAKDGTLTLKDGVTASDNGDYDLTVTLRFRTGFDSVDKKLGDLFGKSQKTVTVKLDLDKDPLKDAVREGNSFSKDVAGTIAEDEAIIEDAHKTLSEAKDIVDSSPELASAIEAYEEALAGYEAALKEVQDALGTLNDKIKDGVKALIDAKTQDELDAAKKAIEDAISALNGDEEKALTGLLEKLANQKEEFGNASDELYSFLGPNRIGDPNAIWIYKGDSLPEAPKGIFAGQGKHEWSEAANLTPEKSGKQPAVFTPNDLLKFAPQPFDVQVNVLDKTDLDNYIDKAEFFLEWAKNRQGSGDRQVAPAAIKALAAAIAKAKTVAGKAAANNTQKAIDDALLALQNAVAALDVNLPKYPGPDKNTQQGGKKDVTKPAPSVQKIRTALKTIYVKSRKVYSMPFVLDGADGKPIKDSKISATSSKSKVLRVWVNDLSIKFKGFKKGKATITLKTQNGKSYKIKVVVVKKMLKLKSFKVKAPKKMKVGKSYQLKIKSLKSKKATSITRIKFKSSNTKVLTVDRAGKVTALKKGKAKITVTLGKKKVKKTIKVK